MTKKLRDRPYASCLLSQQIRKCGRVKVRKFTEAHWDQFVGKTRTAAALYPVCDMADKDPDFKVSDMWKWLSKNWKAVQAIIDKAPEADLSAPELFYNMAPQGRGRKARRAMAPRFQTLPDFVADKEATLEQIENEKKSPKPISKRIGGQVTEVAKPLGTQKDLDAPTV